MDFFSASLINRLEVLELSGDIFDLVTERLSFGDNFVEGVFVGWILRRLLEEAFIHEGFPHRAVLNQATFDGVRCSGIESDIVEGFRNCQLVRALLRLHSLVGSGDYLSQVDCFGGEE